MKNNYYLLLVLILLPFIGNAQKDCCTADPLFGPIQVSVPNNSGSGMPETLSTCSCLAANEHDSWWFAFECINSGTFEMMITPNNLEADYDFALFANECPCGGGTQVTSCSYVGPIFTPPFVPTGISSDPMGSFGVAPNTEINGTVSLSAGTTYYLIADNITSNGVGFTIDFAGSATFGPVAPTPPLPPPTPIFGANTTCPNAIEDYSTPIIPTATDYTWSVTPPTAAIFGQGTNQISVAWGFAGSYDLCVEASNGCETSIPFCVPVVVNPLPPTVETDGICIGGTYTAPNGQVFSAPGSYPLTYTSYQGCDSIVNLILTPLFFSQEIFVEEICEGDCVELGTNSYCEAGTYEETFTNYVGCDSIVILTLIILPTEAIITPDPPEVIGCINTTVTLDGSNSTGGLNLTYQWMDGSGTIVGTDPTLAVTEGGTYTLQVTGETGGGLCSDESSVVVEDDITPPDAEAVGGVIGCNNPVLALMGNTSTPFPTYEWTGPNNFSSFFQNPPAAEPGIYNLTVTALNGCTATATAEITGNTDTPDVEATGGMVDCLTPNANLTGSSTTPGVTYEWTGPNNFTSMEQNPAVSEPGIYTLIVTAPNTCTAETTTELIADNTPPDISATGGMVDCINTMTTLNGNSITAGVTYEWTGPNSFFSDEQNPTATDVGIYTLIVTGTNGCTAETMAEVTSDVILPEVSAAGGTTNCLNPTLNLNGSSTTAGVTYSWEGPNNFMSDEQNPTVSEEGIYTLTVTAANGCTSATTAEVINDSELPNATASGDTTDCDNPAVPLTGSSTTPDVVYSWTGPNNFMSGEQNPAVSEPGIYTLLVTASNGCTAEATAELISNSDLPDITASGGTINCTNPSITLLGNSTTTGVTYSWEGPSNFTSDEQNPSISVSGDYTLTILAPNGCSIAETIEVINDTAPPEASANGDTIDCTNSFILLNGTSITADVTYNWSGPNNFTSDEAMPAVTEAGTYILTVTAPNGCENTANAIVVADQNQPEISVIGDTLDCTNPAVTIFGNSITPNVSYEWSGPNSFSSMEQNPNVSEAGNYNLLITAPNGCTNTATAIVEEDAAVPDIAVIGGTIDCNNLMIALTGSSTSPDVTYAWTGPNSFISDEENPTISEAGIYSLIITAPNGCTNTADADVQENLVQPDILTEGGILTCDQNSLDLVGSSSVAGVTYNWSGPGAFESQEQNPAVSEAGAYILTVTALNGCTQVDTAQVILDGDVPDVSAVGGTLNCNVSELSLIGTSNTADVTFSWEGPNNFTSDIPNPIIDVEGAYILTVTALNDCAASATAVVQLDNSSPDIQVEGGELDCNLTSLALTSNTMTLDVIYQWNGPNSFTSDEANPTVNEAGIYTLMITAPNGCTNTADAQVFQNATLPDVSTVGGTIDCNNLSIPLSGNSNTPDVTFNWEGPNNFTSDEQNPMVSESGIYTLTVTATNGCMNTSEAEVFSDLGTPDATAAGGTIDCNNSSIPLLGNSNTPDVTYTWTGPNTFSSNEQNPVISEAGMYELTVTAANGCTTLAQTEVFLDTTPPDISATGNTIDCNNMNVSLSGNSNTADVTYAWTGPNVFNSNDPNPIVSESGFYTLVVTASNGCTAEMMVEVINDTTPPDATSTNATITCNVGLVDLLGSSNVPGAIFSWEGPSGFMATGDLITVNEIGDYILTVTAPNGCTATSMSLVEQDADLPNISASGGIITCDNPMVPLTGNSTTPGVLYQWTDPNGNMINGQVLNTSFPGIYILTVIATNGCDANMNVTVEEDTAIPDVTASGGLITCDQTSVQLLGNSTTLGVNYSWVGPGGTIIEDPNPFVMEAGLWTLTVTAQNGCSNFATAQVELDSDVPQITLESGILTCALTQTDITSAVIPSNVSYNWVGPNSFTSTEQNPTISQSGIYTLTVTADNDCTATASIEVSEDIIPPNILISPTEQLDCNTPSLTLDATASDVGTGFELQWTTNGGNIISGETTPTPIIDGGGFYILTITDLNNGCTASEDIQVFVSDDLPSGASIFSTMPSCLGESDGIIGVESVEGGTPPYSYALNGSDFTTVPQFGQLLAGDHELIIQDVNGCEWATTITLEQPIELTTDVTVNLTEPAIKLGETIQLIAKVNISPDLIEAILWSPNADITCKSCLDPIVIPLVTTTYTVTVIDVNGCSATDEITIEVDPARNVYIPNVFSPNNDGANDFLYIYGDPARAKVNQFLVLNRWGETMFKGKDFQINDATQGWDGTHRGEKLNPGVYVFFAEIEFFDGRVELYKGEVVLVR